MELLKEFLLIEGSSLSRTREPAGGESTPTGYCLFGDINPTGFAEIVIDTADVTVLVQPNATAQDGDDTGNHNQSIAHSVSGYAATCSAAASGLFNATSKNDLSMSFSF